MHLVLIAWLYVIGVIALNAAHAVLGLLLFVSVGLGPVLGWLVMRARQLRSRREQGVSGLQKHVHQRDDADS